MERMMRLLELVVMTLAIIFAATVLWDILSR